jgi:hypothetical protein
MSAYSVVFVDAGTILLQPGAGGTNNLVRIFEVAKGQETAWLA